MEELAIKGQEDAIVEMNSRHALLGLEGLRKVMQRITGDDNAGVKAIDPSKLTPQDCSRLIEVLAKLERLARGAETERVENTGAPVVIRLAPGLETQHILNPEQGVGYIGPPSPELPPPRELPPPSSN